jgi:hypothetical protein
MNEEADSYKHQITKQAMQIEHLQKEVDHLNMVLKRYRNTINNQCKINPAPLNSHLLHKLDKATVSQFNRTCKYIIFIMIVFKIKTFGQ